VGMILSQAWFRFLHASGFEAQCSKSACLIFVSPEQVYIDLDFTDSIAHRTAALELRSSILVES
jgi:hypothetical protein